MKLTWIKPRIGIFIIAFILFYCDFSTNEKTEIREWEMIAMI